MIELASQNFYHIHSFEDEAKFPNHYSSQWISGNTLTFGKVGDTTRNLLFERINEPYINFSWERDHISTISRCLIEASGTLSSKSIQAEFFENGLLFKYFELVREVVFEEVRKSIFPLHPSRLNGIWLVSKEKLDLWVEFYSNKNIPYKIFEVLFSGICHKADGRWINNATLQIETIYLNALGYWNGHPKYYNSEPLEEFICNGKIKILKEL